jgi:hypothetical protein
LGVKLRGIRMDRVERRRLERDLQKEDKRNKLWYDKLPVERKMYIERCIEARTIQNDNLVASIMDKCFVGAMDDNLDVDVEEVKQIINESNEYIADYKLYLDKEGYERGFDMIENVELREQVKAKIRGYMSGGMDKARGLRLLKSEFKLPNAELSDLWMECKPGGAVKNMKKSKSKQEKFLEEVAIENEKILNKDISENIDKGINQVVDENVEEAVVDCVKRSKLKVMRTTVEVAGEFGIYLKGPDGVSKGDKHYNDLGVVEDEENAVRGEYEASMGSIEAEIAALNAKLNEIREEGMKKLESYTELREVFSIYI